MKDNFWRENSNTELGGKKLSKLKKIDDNFWRENSNKEFQSNSNISRLEATAVYHPDPECPKITTTFPMNEAARI